MVGMLYMFFHKTFESPQIFNIIMMSSVKKYMVVWAHHFEQFWDMTFSDLGTSNLHNTDYCGDG